MTGKPGHRLEDPLEVGLLHRQQLVERDAARRLVARQDHLLHDRQPVLGHEHVLGAAEADALGAELARLGGVLGRVRVRAHAQPAELVGPVEDRAEVLVDRRRHEPDRADDDPAGAAVDRDHVADVEHVLADRHRPRAARRSRAPRSPRRTACPCRARRRPRARSCRRAPSARRGPGSGRGCRPASSPSGRGSRRRPPCRAPRPCRRRARSRPTRRRATRSGPARRPRPDALGSIIGWSSWSSWPGSIRATASSREISPSPAISTAIRSAAVAVRLPGARLQQVQPALLDRELDVLHVAVVRLEPLERRRSAARTPPAAARCIAEIGSGVRIPATTSSPWALTRNSP